jgi:hypothetical protein
MTTPALQVYRIPGLIQRLIIGAAPGDTVTSEPWSVMKGTKALTVILPNFDTSTVATIEVLTPLEISDTTQTWIALNIVKLDDLALVAFSFADTKAFTIPTAALGGGLLRWKVANTQAAAPLYIYHIWTRDG